MKLFEKIPGYITLCIKIFLFQFLIFSLLRFLFYFFTSPDITTENAIALKAYAFRMGFEFDMVIICYLLLPTLLFLFIHSLFLKTHRVAQKFILTFVIIILSLFDLLWFIDIPYYLQFGNHLNKQALLWEASPGFVVGMIFGSFSYWGYLLLFIPLLYFTYRMLKRFFSDYLLNLQHATPKKLWASLAFFVFGIGLLIVGARGRLSPKSTIHEGLAVISDNAYINNLGLNPNFTFFRSVLSATKEIYKTPANINKDIAFTREYLGITTPYVPNLKRQVSAEGSTKNYNVVVVIMESMCLFKMGYYNGENLTPSLNSLIKESVYFDKFFSSGIHTYNGLFSAASGYPAILDEHSLMNYRKQPFASLPLILGKNNYEAYFFTTHDPHFDNMSGFYQFNGFNNIYSQFDMPAKKAISSLGVPDHVLFDKFIDVVNQRKNAKPFISYIMTASDHGPWKVPEDIAFKPNAQNEKDRATQYADWAIGHFMAEAKKQSWYKNTVFLFLGDHGLSMGHTYEMPLSYHHIPLVVHCPSILKPDTIHHLGYQPDINATVMGILNRPYTNESFGVDLFKQSHPFVMFTADDKIGCVDTNGYYYYELLNTNVKRLRKYEHLDPKDYYNSNRKLANELEQKAKSVLETARFFVHKNYFVY